MDGRDFCPVCIVQPMYVGLNCSSYIGDQKSCTKRFGCLRQAEIEAAMNPPKRVMMAEDIGLRSEWKVKP